MTGGVLDDAALDQLFNEARSYNAWLEGDVSDEQIRAIYDLMKMAPTSANQQPARLVWCKSAEAKARLAAHAMDKNQPKITTPGCIRQCVSVRTAIVQPSAKAHLMRPPPLRSGAGTLRPASVVSA